MTTPDADFRHQRRRRVAGIGLVALLAAVLVAVVVVRSNAEKVINTDGDTVILVDKTFAGGMDALGGGVLADVGGCLGWTSRRGSDEGATVVIWPHGTSVTTADPLRVDIDGKTYRIGDKIQIPGGEVGPLEPTSYFYDRVPKACRTA
ncbi:MAG: hypothetical protein JWP31_637, partial [Aeromicrobium sp.]|nr:hypothetical protein [Aeromicrobium sp.]